MPRYELPPGPGRPKGSKNKAALHIQKFARSLLESPEYVISLKARILNGTLPPAVEVMLHHYAYGKPRETVDLNVNNEQATRLQDLSAEALAQEAQETARQILAYKQEAEDAALHDDPPVSDTVQ